MHFTTTEWHIVNEPYKKNGKCYLESINSKYSTVEILPENTLKVYGKIVGVEIDGW